MNLDYTPTGKEIGEILVGNALVRWAAQKGPENSEYDALLIRAENHYHNALNINPNYGRAMMGLHGVKFLQAVKYINLGTREDIDKGLAILEDAEILLDQSLLPQNDLIGANLNIKSHFERGKTQLIIYIANNKDFAYLDQAQNEFQIFLVKYEQLDSLNKERLENYAGHSYARLGYIYLQRYEDNRNYLDYQNLNWQDMALNMYNSAIKYVTPYSQAKYYCIKGKIYLSRGESDIALEQLNLGIGHINYINIPAPMDCSELSMLLTSNKPVIINTPDSTDLDSIPISPLFIPAELYGESDDDDI